MRRRVWLLFGTNSSEEHIASTIKIKRISELGTTLAVTSNSVTATPAYVIYLLDCLLHFPKPTSSTHLSSIPFYCFLSHILILRSALQLLLTTNIVPSSLILSTIIMEVICTSETYVLIGATRHYVPEDGILHVQLSWYLLWAREWQEII
jgi:hypothetical protein